MGDFPVRMDQKGGVGTTWPPTLSQGLLSLLALIRNHPNRSGIRVSLQSPQALLGRDAKTASAAVDQKTGFRGPVGWTCHRRNPSQSPIHHIHTHPSRLRENSVYPQCTIESYVERWCQNSLRMLKKAVRQGRSELSLNKGWDDPNCARPTRGVCDRALREHGDRPSHPAPFFSIQSISPVAVRRGTRLSSRPCDIPGY